ncbi:MAG TPA: STY0301 family protein [Alphaproteobacteria bacterium]|jgi:hypothetical protein|nr:STY0301 family protein [Alphaproteobacteria bacterium]
MMMRSYQPLLPLLLALTLAGPCSAADAPSCPKTIQVSQKPAVIPEGFHGYVDGNPPTADLSAAEKVELERIAFSDGPPTEIGWLAPDHDERTYQVFTFAGSKDTPVWLTCGYSNTSIIISMPLPPEIKSCKVTHDPSVQGYPATGMTCR